MTSQPDQYVAGGLCVAVQAVRQPHNVMVPVLLTGIPMKCSRRQSASAVGHAGQN